MVRLAVCPDCPATRNSVFASLVSDGSACAFRCIALGARQPFPVDWLVTYGMALVRRGVVVRQRTDARGGATAIDAVGAGGLLPLGDANDPSSSAYAAGDTMLCLCPREPLRAAVDAGAPTSSEMLALHASALDRVERLADARSRATALGRVAAALCALADTLTPPRRLDTIPAALQQRDLAALMALRHESVCRALGLLEGSGAIQHGRDGIRLLDRTRLEAV